MIFSSPSAKTILESSTNISTRIGCTFEYNMNTLVDNITVTGTDIVAADGSKPFKKLFPVDSIIKANRPVGAGIKYAITGDVATNSYRNPKSISYPIAYRTYYPGVDTSYKYYLTAKSTGADITLTYPKTILTNKIVARFELSHSTPATWTIFGNGTQIATGSITEAFATLPARNYNAGTVTIYYNGTSWTTTEPLVPSAPVSLTSIRLTTSAVTNKYVGVIEFSPKWVVDVSDRISTFNISKESSTGADDILPVGKVSANSLSLGLISYEDNRTVQSFDKTFTLDPSKIYLYKQIEIKPYIKLYFTGAALTDSNGQYEKFNQGVFYCDTWSTGEYGDVDLTALDSAKILQETLCPSLLCEGYSIPGIFRRLLDAIGFTNYNINTAVSESSPLSPRFWWSDDTKTVWQAIQELCRDSQITAVFDENNVLQFYTRDYLFNSARPTDWSFRLNANGSLLPNIISLSKTDLASANQVKILWNSVTTNEYSGSAQPLWQASRGWMAALSLDQNLYTSDLAGSYIKLSVITTNEYESGKIIDEYSGYLVIDSEIIEYDGIEYFYKTTDGNAVNVVVENDSDVLKFLGLGAVGSDKTGRTGRVRIKTRGAFGTTIANHYAAAQDIIDSWSGYEVTWVG
jgi:hypothetical protein